MWHDAVSSIGYVGSLVSIETRSLFWDTLYKQGSYTSIELNSSVVHSRVRPAVWLFIGMHWAEANLSFWLSSRNFFRGKSVVMQISFVIIIFVLFSDQISAGGGGQTAAPAPLWKSQVCMKKQHILIIIIKNHKGKISGVCQL